MKKDKKILTEDNLLKKEASILIDDTETTASEEENVELEVENSVIREKIMVLGEYILTKIKEYRYVIALDFVIFLLLFFLIPTVILEVKPVVWMTAFIVFTMLPTIGVYGFQKFRDKQIVFGFIFIYFLIFLVLDKCILLDLYGITDHGTLDYVPAWFDAVLVTIIIVFLQYIAILLVDGVKKIQRIQKRKRAKKEME